MYQNADVIIIGAGHAGLSASYFLKTNKIDHLVLERGRIGESWLSKRWNSFLLNTDDAINQLPGEEAIHSEESHFSSAADFAGKLKRYVQKFNLPVVEQCEVISVEKPSEANFKLLILERGIRKQYLAKQVIICSGAQNEMDLPEISKKFGAEIKQLHAGEFRNEAQLPAGSVLVVGSAQSGCQIAIDLAKNGRQVYLSTSMVPRVPRFYRGRDIMDWLILAGFFDAPAEAASAELQIRAPQLSGGKDTTSYQSMSALKIVLQGKLKDANQSTVLFYPDVADHIKFADAFSGRVRGMIDEMIGNMKVGAPNAVTDDADSADHGLLNAHYTDSLQLKDCNIKTVIWATGFTGNFKYLKLPVCDATGNPMHNNGVSKIEGLYFLGLPWLRTRKSGLIYGIGEDAEWICGHVLKSTFQHMH